MVGTPPRHNREESATTVSCLPAASLAFLSFREERQPMVCSLLNGTLDTYIGVAILEKSGGRSLGEDR